MASTTTPQEALLQLDAIPTPRAAAERLLELARDPGSTADEFAAVIETDPGLAAQLMRDANDLSRQHTSCLDLRAAAHAVERDTLTRLAFCAITPESVQGNELDEDANGTIALRRHCVAVAAVARELARQNDYPVPAEAYGAGLLSAIGSLALATLMPKQAAALRRQINANEAESAQEQELQAFGFDNEQMAMALSEAWDFSTEMRDVLYFLNRSVEAIERECPTLTQDLVSYVRTGMHCAMRAGYHAYEAVPESEVPADVRKLLKIADREALEQLMRQALENVDRVATPLNKEPEARAQSLRIANNELARLLARSEHKGQAADAVISVMQYGLQRLGDGDPLPGLMYRTMESMGFKRMTFVTIDAVNGRLAVKTSSALRGSIRVPEGSSTPLPGGHPGFQDAAILTRDTSTPQSACVLDLLGINACVMAPISDPEGQVAGFLAADRGLNGSMPVSGDEYCLGIIAAQATLLLRFEQLSREQARMATVDPLTGAATRRKLMDRLEDLISLSNRTQIPLSIAMMDLDHFKKFNDTLGHQVGDRLLQDLVKVLSAGVRKSDLVARYGGEEFIVVFPDATLDNAWMAADKLRRAVFDFGKEHSTEYENLSISISIGVAQLRTDENGDILEDAMALIGRADEVLYQAKHNGRNRVERAA